MREMMKHTIHVTVTYSVEIDDQDLKREFGKATKKMILEAAKGNFDKGTVFDCVVKVHDSYDDAVKTRKGIGSY
jgi:hypothetical protein